MIKELIMMSDKRHRSACALTRNLCSNYDRSTGGCLLLDRGEIVQCPQMITQSLVCRFFRDVLLEDRDGRALKAEIMGDDHLKSCAVCGQPFRAISNRAKYCARCSKKMERERISKWAKKTRHHVDV